MKTGRREALVLGAAGLAAATAGFLVGPLLTGGNAAEGALKVASFPDLSGRPRAIAEWRGRVLVLNFWATWCAPCREEIPLLMKTGLKYQASGLEVVGIAIDNGAKVGEYARNMQISYPILLAEAEGLDLMRKLGNSAGGLPYTVIVDRQGAVLQRKLGAYKAPELEATLAPLLRS
jgi:thiol-disulfide isomerase/thioredoxin